MKLDRGTYEAWLLDRMEGRLSPAQGMELDAFLHANPDLPSSSVDLPGIEDGAMEFPLKSALRKDHPPTGTPDAARLDDFLVARYEKALNAQQEKQLDRFLYENPGAGKQAALMAMAHVPKDPIIFPAKATVERHFPPEGMPDAHRLNDFLIAALEGDLTKDQRAALKRYITGHVEAAREERLVAATRTLPLAIPFAGKEGLKKREVRVLALWPRLAAAACFLLLVGAGWWLMRERPTGENEVAHVERSTSPREPSPPVRDRDPADNGQPNAAQGKDMVPQEQRSAPVEKHIEVNGRATPKPVRMAPDPVDVREQDPGSQNGPAAKPAPEPITLEEPELAQQAEVPTELPTAQAPVEHSMVAVATKAGSPPVFPAGSSQDLGTFVANTLRGEVLETPQRRTDLDGKDVLAFADKAIGAVTGGKGSVSVEKSAAGQRFQLRFGRNFSVSASRAR